MSRRGPYGLTMSTESFEDIVVAYRRRLYLYALQMVCNHEDAEDAAQDAFVRAYRAWEKMDPKPLHNARLTGWLYMITLNVVRNRFRRKQLPQVRIDEFHDSDSWQTELDDRSSPEAIVDRDTTFGVVERAIRELPAHLVSAARLRFIEDLTHPQIAEHCSQPLGTVKSHVFRARLLLREMLPQLLGASA